MVNLQELVAAQDAKLADRVLKREEYKKETNELAFKGGRVDLEGALLRVDKERGMISVLVFGVAEENPSYDAETHVLRTSYTKKNMVKDEQEDEEGKLSLVFREVTEKCEDEVQLPAVMKFYVNDRAVLSRGFGSFVRLVAVYAKKSPTRVYYNCSTLDSCNMAEKDVCMQLLAMTKDTSYSFKHMKESESSKLWYTGDSVLVPMLSPKAMKGVKDFNGGLVAVLDKNTGVQYEVVESAEYCFSKITFGVNIFAPKSDVISVNVNRIDMISDAVYKFGVAHLPTLSVLANKMVRNANIFFEGHVTKNLVGDYDENGEFQARQVPSMWMHSGNFIVNVREMVRSCGIEIDAGTAREIIDVFSVDRMHKDDNDDILGDEVVEMVRACREARSNNILNNMPNYPVVNLCEFNKDPSVFLDVKKGVTFYAIANGDATTQDELLEQMDTLNIKVTCFALFQEPFVIQGVPLKETTKRKAAETIIEAKKKAKSRTGA